MGKLKIKPIINYHLKNKVVDSYLPAAYLPSNGALAVVHAPVRAAAAAVGNAATGSLAAAAVVSSTATVISIKLVPQGVPQRSMFGLVLDEA